ncbi:energy-coupling factor transporter transmembrane component T family protein [Nocardioides alcanivorans]|uniref:energy-coupling factor transporter transmembrane component T family protein n=1 Tax=Nocardioides alcanivorans TaxID=2897352 RepID=UPI001F374B81|nr:energy-coupling factor transporter transmembrane protein EcfT [Nocardioides alcanivorans]
MSQVLIGLHRPGNTLLHRLPVGFKVVALGVFSLTVVLVRDARASFLFLAFALTLAAIARVPLRHLWRAARAILLLAVFVAAFQWWWYGAEKAVETLVDLVALALAAVVVTSTTAVNAMLDAIVRWLQPFRRIGVDPEKVALAFSLAIGALPGTVTLALETRDAARARGLSKHPRAYLTPFVVRVVARALETGDALHARGITDREA